MLINMDFYGCSLNKRLAWVLAFVLGGAGIVLMQRSRLSPVHPPTPVATQQQQSQREKWQLNILQALPGFGFDNLIADGIYLRFIQYFGDTPAREAIGHHLIPDYFRAVLQRDPRFADAMILMATANSLYAGEPQQTVQNLDQSLRLISPQQTAFVHPLYFLWVYKGRDEFLFLGDAKAAIKSYTVAIRWAKAIATPKSLQSVKNLTATNQSLGTNPRSQFARIGAWSLVLSANFEPQTQARIIAEIKALGGSVTQTEDGRFLVQVPEGVDRVQK